MTKITFIKVWQPSLHDLAFGVKLDIFNSKMVSEFILLLLLGYSHMSSPANFTVQMLVLQTSKFQTCCFPIADLYYIET